MRKQHKNIFLVYILTLLVAFSADAQGPVFSLKGKISDPAGNGVEGVNGLLRRQNSKAMLGFALS